MNESARSWTAPADLRTQVLRLWERGDLLACMIEPADLFPLRLVLRAPTSSELSARFDEVRAWTQQLKEGEGAGYRLVQREVRHLVIGQNSLPGEAWVDTLADAFRLAGKGREARAFQVQVDETRTREPTLLPWLQRQPLRALVLASQWSQLLDVLAWLRVHPRPGIYLRQVDLPGIHSKFIEGQRAVLAELFDLTLPPDAIDNHASGVAGFNQRYGFRDKPQRVRLRFLDSGLAPWAHGGDPDFTILQSAFTHLAPAPRRVFITENEVNFLAFPQVKDSLLIFGAGYGFDALTQAAWLAGCSLHYWGDIDTHGFAILDQLRAHLPHARSFLMDHATLLAHRTLWTEEPQPTKRDLPRLNAEERRLYDDLRWRRLDDLCPRLEQERIGFRFVEDAVAAIVNESA